MGRKRNWYGQLPDGKETRDVDAYIKAWDEFTLPVCEALGLERIGYDPGLLAKAKGEYGSSVNFDNWLLRRLNKLLATP